MKEHNMEYNSSRENLAIPEYGRHVQNLVNYAKTIEDDDFRQAFIERILDLMMQMHPQNKIMDDYKEKLWKHLFRIANYELNVKVPGGHIPTKEEAEKKPEKIPYPASEARYRHYGNNVQRLIKKALEMEAGPVRDGFVATIGSYMKLAYRTWNKEHYVSDETIKSDLETLSGGILTLDDDATIDNLTSANRSNSRRKKMSGSGHNGNGSNNYQGRSSRNNSNYKGRRRKP
ncbi:MAG: hypothetical protein DHS20C18_20950 [Saprospiraceae bacterium]|nr:MAG: hypothetical protein DHS20C18_20950 [Saprospiraceae bacterium]